MKPKGRRKVDRLALDWVNLILLSGALTGDLIDRAINDARHDIENYPDDKRPRSVTIKLTLTPGEGRELNIQPVITCTRPSR